MPRTERLETIPEPPSKLAGPAADYWRKVAPELAQRGTLTTLALPAFEILCRTWAEHQRLSEWLAGDPSRAISETRNGYKSESVEYRQCRAALADLHRLWQKFGMLPGSTSARSKTAASEYRDARGMTLEDWADLKTKIDADESRQYHGWGR